MDTIESLTTELQRLERLCAAQTPAVDVRPWVSNRHQLSTDHWGLTQRKLRLMYPGRHGGLPKSARPPQARKTLTPEHLAAMLAGRKANKILHGERGSVALK